MALGQTIFRDNRRRRVLQDEARRASNCAPSPVTEGSRYTDAANVENHPQITQFIPRRYRSYALGLAFSGVAITAIELLHLWARDLARHIGNGPVIALDLAAGGGLAAWFSGMVLAVLSVGACIIYSLRKHRVNDYKARYRLWLWVAAAALLASIDSVATLHQVWSSLWVRQTGWAGLDGAAWWLVPAAVVGSWLTLRMVLETAECRGACSLVVVSAIAYGVAFTSTAGVLPAAWRGAELVVVSSTLLIGHVIALTAVLLYARFIVLDVQGLIPRKAGRKLPARTTSAGRQSAAKSLPAPGQDGSFPATIPLNSPAADTHRKQSRRSVQSGNEQSAWVDGSEPDEDAYEDRAAQIAGKLSKADRKRLRKQRRQCA